MSRFDTIRVRTALAVTAALVLWTGSAFAQTTVVLDAPDTESVDTAVRGGSHASTNFDSYDLGTSASSSTE